MDSITADDTLAEDYETLLAFLYTCPAGLLQLDNAGDVQLANPPAVQLLLPLLAVQNLDNLFDCLEGYAPEIRNLTMSFTESRGTICESHRIYVSPASDDPLVLSCTLLRIHADCLMAVLGDVSKQVAQERRLQQAESWFGTLLSSVQDFAIFSLDRTGHIDTWNASAYRHTGSSEQQVVGRTLQYFYGNEPASRDKAARQIECARREGWAVEDARCLNGKGKSTWTQSMVAALREQDGEIHGFSVVMRDITERKMSTEDLRRLLTTDHLTGAANRARLFDIAETEIARWKRHGSPLCAIMMDVDHFKSINDTLGHQTGDTVLRALVARCRDELRAVDTLARYGGEEFVVLLPGMGMEEAMVAAERLRGLVAGQALDCGGISVPVTLSLGCAGMEAPIDTLEALLVAADAAMYRAKRLGRNRAEAYHSHSDGRRG